MKINSYTNMIESVALDFRNEKYLTWRRPEHKDKFRGRTFYTKCMEAVNKALHHGQKYIWLSSDKNVSKLLYQIFDEMCIPEDDYDWNYGRVTIGISRDRVIMTHSDTKANSGEPYEVIFGKPFEVD